MHYSDDDETPRPGHRPGRGDDDLTGPAGPEDDDLVGPRRGGARSAGFAGPAGEDELAARRRPRRRSILDDDEDEPPRPLARSRRGPRGRGESGGVSAASFRAILRDVPAFLKLLARLARDPRVSVLDKAIVAAVLVYLVSPVDLIPDFAAPVLGQVEDVYLLALALSRLLNQAGMDVLLDHWEGDAATLETALSALDRAGSLLPGPIRAVLGHRGG
ncbi:MAG TPA: DUF1232 domain-containing protein [Longimicrobium sp.]|nr:DUF1232 domain-containing protein [Longimicrobium sp.]